MSTMLKHQLDTKSALQTVDPVWTRIRDEAEEIVRREPELATFIYSTVLHHDRPGGGGGASHRRAA